MTAILIAAIVSGSIYALISLGSAIAFRLSGVFNLSHGGLLVTAGYLNHFLVTSGRFSAWLAIPLAIALAGAVGFLIEAWAIPRAKAVGLKSVDLMILSWLALVVIQNLLALAFSNASIYMGGSEVSPGWAFLGTRITPFQMSIVAISFTAGLLLLFLARKSATGREILAVGDNARMAMICGVNVRRIIATNAAVASCLTAGAGVLLSYHERLDPALGMRFSVIGIISTLAGSRLGPAGAVVGGLGLALAESLVLYCVDPALRNATVYLCLFGVVLFTYRHSSVPTD